MQSFGHYMWKHILCGYIYVFSINVGYVFMPPAERTIQAYILFCINMLILVICQIIFFLFCIIFIQTNEETTVNVQTFITQGNMSRDCNGSVCVVQSYSLNDNG